MWQRANITANSTTNTPDTDRWQQYQHAAEHGLLSTLKYKRQFNLNYIGYGLKEHQRQSTRIRIKMRTNSLKHNAFRKRNGSPVRQRLYVSMMERYSEYINDASNGRI